MRFAYTPILRMLEVRRQQIAGGLANAAKIKAELDRIEADRMDVLTKADAQGKQLIEEARAAAARVLAGRNEERHGRRRADHRQSGRGTAEQRTAPEMLAEVKHEVGRLVVQTTASVTGKIFDAGGSPPPGGANRPAARVLIAGARRGER